jgi:hypothetical protein
LRFSSPAEAALCDVLHDEPATEILAIAEHPSRWEI